MIVEVIIGNIANLPDIDAVVNSANGNLRLGASVAGAIHTAAGQELEEYCQQFAPFPQGRAVITLVFDEFVSGCMGHRIRFERCLRFA